MSESLTKILEKVRDMEKNSSIDSDYSNITSRVNWRDSILLLNIYYVKPLKEVYDTANT